MGVFIPMTKFFADLLRRNAPNRWEEDLVDIRRRAQLVREGAAFTDWFTSYRHMMAECTLGYGRLCQQWFPEVVEGLERTVAHHADHDPSSFSNLTQNLQLCALQCAGVDPSPDSLARAAAWLPEVVIDRSLRDGQPSYAYEHACAALVAGQHDLARRIHGHGAPEGFTPGQTFGFDIFGLIAYLDAAIAYGADFDDLVPAWEDYLAAVPHIRASITYLWMDVLWMARLFRHEAGRRPLHTVGDWTSAELRRFVGLQALSEGDAELAHRLLSDIPDYAMAELTPARQAQVYRGLAEACRALGRDEEAAAHERSAQACEP